MSSFERMGKAAPSGGYICTLSEEDLASQRGCVHPLLLLSLSLSLAPTHSSLTNAWRLVHHSVIWDLVKSFGKNLVAAKELTSTTLLLPLLSSFATFPSFMIYRFVVTLLIA